MKNLVRTIATLLFLAGATPAFAAPVSLQIASQKITIALPVAQFDFSDLDVRDEFNRPVAAPLIRQRFESLLNRELNRLLVENLTPLRRAWIAMLDSARDVFGDWLSSAKRQISEFSAAVLRGHPILFALTHWRGFTLLSVSSVRSSTDERGALALLLQLLSSTRLLR